MGMDVAWRGVAVKVRGRVDRAVVGSVGRPPADDAAGHDTGDPPARLAPTRHAVLFGTFHVPAELRKGPTPLRRGGRA